MKYKIEKMLESHLDGVLELERLSFPKPWTRRMLEGELINEAAKYSVCIANGKIIAYGGYLYTADGADITNIAVHPDCRRMGIGGALLAHMTDEASALGARHMVLEVRVSNEAAISLYKGFGFTLAGRRRRYYSDNGEDALIMIKEW